MADGVIYTHTGTEKALIVPARHGFLRAFDAGAWTSLVIGFYWSYNGSPSVAAASVNESVVPLTPAGRIFVGLKNSNVTLLPHTTGSNFLGFFTDPAYTGSFDQLEDGTSARLSGQCRIGGSQDATILGPAGVIDPINYMRTVSRANEVAITNFCRFLGMKFTITGLGTGAQQVKVEALSTTVHPAITVPDSTSLRAKFTTATLHDSGFFTFLGTIPDAIFFYLPFYNNYIRLHAMAVEKFA